jgi:hypothetical protein
MTDIIIYTTPEKLLHKQDKLENDPDKSDTGDYVWKLKHLPKYWEELIKESSPRIYFATKGFIRGYFLCDYIDDGFDDYELGFESKSWKDITPIPIKHFQGFKYADKVPELSKHAGG